MEEIQLTDFYTNFYSIIKSVSLEDKAVMIADKEKPLVKIVPVFSSESSSWLGCMRKSGKIIGDIISPAEDSDGWKVLSE